MLSAASLGACSSKPVDAGICPTTEACAPPYSGQTFLRDFIAQKRPSDYLLFQGRDSAKSITASGATNGNAEWEEDGSGELNIESQRIAWFVVSAGLAATGDERRALLDAGLRALEWSFAQQGDDGSFPLERAAAPEKSNSLHPKSEFLYAAASCLVALTESEIDPDLRARVEVLRPKLARSASWMAGSQDLVTFFTPEKNTNQRLFIVSALQLASVVGLDPALATKAEELLTQTLESQTPEGVLPEDGGFDSSYQMVSVELLVRFASTVTDDALRGIVFDATRRGVDAFLARVAADGTIDTSDNTRTAGCGDPIPGCGPKGKDVDVIPLRLHEFAFLAGKQCEIGPVAEAIESQGQGFDHIETCG